MYICACVRMCVVKMPHTMPQTYSLTLTVAFAIRLHCWLICFEINAKLIYTTHRQFIQPFAPTAKAVSHSPTHLHTHTHSVTHSFMQTCSQAYKILVCLFLYSLRKHVRLRSRPPFLWSWTWRGSCKILIVQPTNKLANNWSQTGRETGHMSGTAP